MWVLFLHENSTRFVCRNFKFSRILKYYLFFRLDFGFAEIRTQDKLLFLRTTFWCNLTRDYSIDTLYKLSITILTVKFASYHLLSLLHCWSSLINNNLRFLIVKETADVIADAIFRKRLKLHNSLCSFNISLVEFDPLWWWVLMDSNHRPLRYQHSALTNWAKDPSSFQHAWWRMTGSNRRPPACKAGALPAELIPREGYFCKHSDKREHMQLLLLVRYP